MKLGHRIAGLVNDTGRAGAGGVLLGLGAVINGACVFGAVARFGSGEWAYAATPLGFLLGSIAFNRYVSVSSVLAGAPLICGPRWLGTLIIVLAL